VGGEGPGWKVLTQNVLANFDGRHRVCVVSVLVLLESV
jgi:hypothetical protein